MASDEFRLRVEPLLAAKREAFPYQEDAVAFVASRQSAAIFHEQGLGKTKIAIDVILRWLREFQVDTALVITKKGLIANWQREFEVHSHLRPLVLSEDGKQNYLAFTTGTRLLLGHYEVARKEERRLRAWLGSRRVGVVLDEAAKIKNPAAGLTQVYHRLAPLFAKRVIMTGTPVANRPYDVWSEIFFLDQGATLGPDFAQFKADHDLLPTYAHDPPAFAAYQRRLESTSEALRHISIRETKDGGCISLPSKEYVRIVTDWEPEQHEMYRRVRDDLRVAITQNGQLVLDNQEAALKRLLRLVQISSNPRLIDEGYSSEPGKFRPLAELISDVIRQGEKVIVWTAFNQNVEWLAAKLSSYGALALHGKMPMERRNQVVEWFLENEEDRVLVATPGAAKEGLTLTVANHVVFYDRTYSLDDYLQAQDRIHRVSQERTCFVYNLIMRDSIDEWIDALLEEKHLAARLTQGDISRETYAECATLSFFEVLHGILG
ncbi:ATP-dependent RNA helicase DbpA [mine drainage metagenome]|uniref:ATP-dependent RNA helicase DbpA n=1 Tax=mine drainage metagenome TaxID=410659 RepID=A0A1J5QBN4_9ZZZZ